MDIETLAKGLGVPQRHLCVVGSTLICGNGKDLDVLCLTSDTKSPAKMGFEPDLEEGELYGSLFSSWRKDSTNLLVTSDESYFASEVSIAHAARVASLMGLDLGSRESRVVFHGSVREAVAHHFDADAVGIF